MTSRSNRKPPCDTCPCPAWGLECAEYRGSQQGSERPPVIDAEPTQAVALPVRGDTVEAWLRAQRDAHSDRYGVTPAYFILDDLLDLYRLHADTHTPLGEHICEGRMAGDCECLEATP